MNDLFIGNPPDEVLEAEVNWFGDYVFKPYAGGAAKARGLFLQITFTVVPGVFRRTAGKIFHSVSISQRQARSSNSRRAGKVSHKIVVRYSLGDKKTFRILFCVWFFNSLKFLNAPPLEAQGVTYFVLRAARKKKIKRARKAAKAQRTRKDFLCDTFASLSRPRGMNALVSINISTLRVW